MKDFLLLMHSDATRPETGWDAYLGRLHASGRFDGGSAIGAGQAYRNTGAAAAVSVHLNGYLRVRAADAQDAESFLAGNPVFEAGGTVEIRELPKD